MTKWLFLLAVCCHCLVFGRPVQERTIDPGALAELAAAWNIPSDADLITEAGKHWLRKPGKERWEITELAPDQKLYVLNWATQQGLFCAWKPLYQSYEKALILGGTTPAMQIRLDFLKQLWNEGIRFQEVVWLTGDRPLDERADDLTERCRNESEAAHILWEETDLPEEMRQRAVTFVAVPMKQDGSSLKRPNTEDTLVAWLQTTPHPCSALFISDQPYCGYQFAVIKATLPEEYEFDLAGQGVDPMNCPSAAAITLDSIIRWIYQENVITNRKSQYTRSDSIIGCQGASKP